MDPDAASLHATAEALSEGLPKRSAEIEQARRLPSDLVEQLVESGLVRLCIPRRLGGLETDPVTITRIVETVARADAATGWCLMIWATSGVVSAYMPATAAREIYGPSDVVTGGAFAPSGSAIRTETGYRVTGRWQWGSGSQHCDWLMGGFHVEGEPPVNRLGFFRADDVEILDTWYASGLRGTGSHDFRVSGVEVAVDRAPSLVADSPVEDGPLYRFPVFGPSRHRRRRGDARHRKGRTR